MRCAKFDGVALQGIYSQFEEGGQSAMGICALCYI